MSGTGAGAVSRNSGFHWTPRLLGLLLVVVCATPLALGWWLEPSAKGHGTHQALGLPPCAFLQVTGHPCMTCGMTTAVSLAAHGRFLDAFWVQPGGALFAIVLASGLWLGLHAVLTEASPVPALEAVFRARIIWIGVGILLAAWGYKLFTF